TAYMLGRLTLNPLKHIDPIMTVLLPVVLWLSHAGFLFGAAKPVPVNPRNYRKFVRGDVIVSLAGIVVNLILFLVFAGLFAVVGLAAERVPSLTASLEILQRMMFYGMRLNLVLAFFNLIPIPPLDGSHVFYHLLPPGRGLKYRQFYQLGMLPLFLILWLAPAVLTPFLWPASALLQLGWSVVGRYALPGACPRHDRAPTHGPGPERLHRRAGAVLRPARPVAPSDPRGRGRHHRPAHREDRRPVPGRDQRVGAQSGGGLSRDGRPPAADQGTDALAAAPGRRRVGRSARRAGAAAARVPADPRTRGMAGGG